jgi:hypothetical protein
MSDISFEARSWPGVEKIASRKFLGRHLVQMTRPDGSRWSFSLTEDQGREMAMALLLATENDTWQWPADPNVVSIYDRGDAIVKQLLANDELCRRVFHGLKVNLKP